MSMLYEKRKKFRRGQFVIEDTGFRPHCSITGEILGDEFLVRSRSSGEFLGYIFKNGSVWRGVRKNAKRTGPFPTQREAMHSLT